MEEQPKPQEERRHSQEHYDGEDRRKQDHPYEEPIGDEKSDRPGISDGDQPL